MQFSKEVFNFNMHSDSLIDNMFVKMVLKTAVFWKVCKTCRNMPTTKLQYLERSVF